jgi:hypothetical protein
MDRKAVRPGETPQDPEPALRPPTMWEVFTHDMHAVSRLLFDWFDPFLNWLLAYTRSGALRRLAIFITTSVILWLFLALVSHPIGRGVDSLAYQLLQSLFSADVLRHILVLWLALFLGTELAATYLDDIFELGNLRAALRYIWAAAFLGGYPKLTIRDGDVASEDKESPVNRIGGPGWVDVHLENVAVFERIDGTPHIVSPEHQSRLLLSGFERLRSVIDLRDQVIELTVTGRTQDGIPVTARDVRLVYSVDRGFNSRQEEEAFDMDATHRTYPFSELAVMNLVYHHGRDPLYEAMRSLIRSELTQFISRHTLSEFLTNAQAGDDKPDVFISRDEITDLFYDYAEEFSRHAEEHGVRLQWIGVGTWVIPAQIIKDRHMDAWKLSNEARLHRSEGALNVTFKDAWIMELLRLIDEVPAAFYTMTAQSLSSDQILRRLALTYREKMRNARDLYLNQEQPVPPELRRVIAHLSVLAAIPLEDDPHS